ncbi:maleylpyruvate isomerase N-terminal domain-containing protein [Cellulomonas sp.]|uniref:maleylpyruvate isomerase N-terminal domain-containing protein n=1 Tax=Cellulomonas sp. TaxID=40001 RepID=UPI0025876C3E|nr:maleylpyruvate isomerase N-terminal domain-containing protein [Cellulomonas sp.]MCR6690220.1 maleylpyruvate isomerase N-terminal domain-containing protein [Cellulomonas sp.]
MALTGLTFEGVLDRDALVPATELLVGLVARPEVAAAWDRESACAGMSVGALTWHLVNQPQRVVELIAAHDPADPRLTTPITADEHYARAEWLEQDLDGPANVGVRERGEQQASAGHDEAVAAARSALAALPGALATAPPALLLPWTGLVLRTDDFLVSRLMEVVVHSDDLAASVGVPVPEFGAATLRPVLTLLTDLAVRRHGQDALVRALARPARAQGAISAL